MNIIKKIAIFLISFVLAYYFSINFGNLYESTITSLSGSFVELRSVFGLPLGYILFLTLLFTAFGGDKKYWWIGVLLIPAVAFELYFDLDHIYFPITLGIIGWVAGVVVSKFLSKFHATGRTI